MTWVAFFFGFALGVCSFALALVVMHEKKQG